MAKTLGDEVLNDTIVGDDVLGDTIYGGSEFGAGGGDDTLEGRGGADSLYGGAGADVLNGGAGADDFFGGLGDDTFDVDVDDGTIFGGGGADTAIFSAGADIVTGPMTLASVRLDLSGGADIFIGAEPPGAGEAVFALSDLDGTTGFRLDGAASNDQSGRIVASAGDINGDGFTDIIVGARFADPNGADSGSTYVVFGKASGWTADIDLSSLDGSTGFRLDGAAANDQSGFSAASAGDVNGDGIGDLVVGAYLANVGASDNGASYVVYGKASGWAPTLNLSSVDGTTGFRLEGETNTDWSGYTVSGVGDVNGDGIDDLAVGAPIADPNGSGAGSLYVVFGAAGPRAASIDLGALAADEGFRFDGPRMNANLGFAVTAGGDVNGDGIDDFLVSANSNNVNGTLSGSVYVVFGKTSAWDSPLDEAYLDGTTGFRLDGPELADQAGSAISSAGDINGDGYDDLIVGSPAADPNGSFSGMAFVVFGKASGWAASTNLGTLDGTNGFTLAGGFTNDQASRSVSSVDLNGDGYDDMIIGAPNVAGAGDDDGAAYVVFGKSSGWTTLVQLTALDGTDGFRLSGAASDGNAGFGVAGLGDVDGDGFGDLVVGAPLADADGNADSGSSYVLFGGPQFGGRAASYTVDGGAGDDTLTGQAEGDSFYGGAGLDLLFGAGGVDWLFGGDLADTLYGGAGNDKLWGGLGGDRLFGGDGTDSLNGKEGADVMSGGAGADYYWVDDAGDVADETSAGSGGADTVWVGVASYDVDEGVERINAQFAGGSTISALGATDNRIYGGAGGDSLFGGAGADSLFGNDGDDRLDPGVGANGSANGGAGIDTLALDFGALGASVTVNGAAASGTVVANATTVTFSSIERRDIGGGALNDMLRGGAGDDTLAGAGGADQIHAADGLDRLLGGDGADLLYGAGGADSLFGGDGGDMLQGGLGDDTMTGGAGRDVYRISSGDGADTISDFIGAGEDRVDLLGALAVSGGLGTDTVLLTGGGSIVASNGHLWQAADFI